MLKACCENTSQNIIIYIYAPAVLNCVASSSSEPFIKLYNTCHMLVHTHTHTHTHTRVHLPHPILCLHTYIHPPTPATHTQLETHKCICTGYLQCRNTQQADIPSSIICGNWQFVMVEGCLLKCTMGVPVVKTI